MPKIFNTSWLAVILATIVFFAIGAVWYGFLFEAQWLKVAGMTKAEADAAMAETGMLKWLIFALLITFAQAIGVLMVIHKTGAKRLPACLTTTFWLLVTLVAPLLAYACVYAGYSLTGYLVDLGIMSLVLWPWRRFMRRFAAKVRSMRLSFVSHFLRELYARHGVM